MSAVQNPAAGASFRPEIQGLRALAVTAVVAFHLSPARLPGGFVGVDVFFVVSGFLITSHLLSETMRTGTLRLRSFYGRRIRRLLPAALVVLAAVLIVTMLFVPEASRIATIVEVAASALYVQNWALAAQSTDYLASGNSPTIVQHFWTLSVEEQFYLLWPILILGLVVLFRRTGKPATPTAFAILFGVVGIGSLAWSVIQTNADASFAFFSTPARIWEFAVGALFALIALRSSVLARLSIGARVALSWLGLSGLAASFVFFGPDTGIPGFAALLPVLSTIAVIAAGSPRSSWSPTVLSSFGPVQYVGSISYSVYLWHWPLVVLYPIVTGSPIGLRAAAGIVAVTLALAALTTWAVENPARRSRLLLGASRRSFAFAAAGMAVVLALSAAGYLATQRNNDASAAAATERLAELQQCGGAAAIDNQAECGDPYVVTEDVNVAAVAQQGHPVLSNTCDGGQVLEPILDGFVCVYGDPEGTRTIAVVGDSHAAQWMPAIEKVAAEQGWRIVTVIRHSCTFSPSILIAEGNPWPPCNDWKREAIERVVSIQPDIAIVASMNTAGYTALDHTFGSQAEQVAGFEEYLSRLEGIGTRVVAVRDEPYMADMVSECLGEGTEADARRCTSLRAEALDTVGDPLFSAAQATPGVTILDFSRYFCDESLCYPIVGNTLVFRDHGHVSVPYVISLTPMIRQGLVDAGIITAG